MCFGPVARHRLRKHALLMPVQVVFSAGLVRGLDVEDCGDLRDFLADLPDPRRRRGRRYGYGALVAVAAAAMLGGANSVAAIFRWARDALMRSFWRWASVRTNVLGTCGDRA